MATHWEPGYQNYLRGTTNACRVANDRFTSGAYVRWTTTEANNLRATGRDIGNGQLRYTQDMRDASNNVDADGFWTSNFPSPAFDRENDGGSEFKHEEAEITAQSSTFPTAGTTYNFSARYSHWSSVGGGACGNVGDNGGGNIGHNEHMSEQHFGEWDTFGFAYSGTKNVSYPYVCVVSPCTAAVSEAGPAPAGSATANTTSRGLPEEGRPAHSLAVPAGAPFRAFEDGAGTFVDPDLGDGLEAYKARVHELARNFLSPRRGGAVVVTLSRPLSANDLADLAAMGLSIQAIEAVGLDAAGERFSAGAPYSEDAIAELQRFAGESVEGGQLEGVVAIEAVLANRAAFDQLQADARVFAVDISAELTRTAAGLNDLPTLNDLYWYLAGWEPVN